MDYKQYVLDNIKFVLDGDMTQMKAVCMIMGLDLLLSLVIWSYID